MYTKTDVSTIEKIEGDRDRREYRSERFAPLSYRPVNYYSPAEIATSNPVYEDECRQFEAVSYLY